jgi:hypothetical protein
MVIKDGFFPDKTVRGAGCRRTALGCSSLETGFVSGSRLGPKGVAQWNSRIKFGRR